MDKKSEIYRLRNDLISDKEFAAKFDALSKEVIDSGECKCDGDVVAKAAQKLGYDISVPDIERMQASVEELNPEELEQLAAGEKGDMYCGKDYDCMLMYHQQKEDGYGHNEICVTAWHCLTAFLHTETKGKERVSCWSDFVCILVHLDMWGKPISEG